MDFVIYAILFCRVFTVTTALNIPVRIEPILRSTPRQIKAIPRTSKATEETTTTSTFTTTTQENQDFVLGSCTWAIGRTCPDKDIKFYLYTRHNLKHPQEIYIDRTLETSNISDSYYDKRYPSKIIIHGYNANMFLHALFLMKNEYLAKGDYNVFYIDWSTLALGPCYINAVHNIQHTGACVAQLVERIRDMGSSDIHVIGFSLGAHITNYIARNLENFTLPRITGLDPALPLFVTSDNNEKLDKSDAHYVDIIHTNALVQGKFERCGHADFYMNGGIFQPNCFKNNPINPFPCFHHRALDYYVESIRSVEGFWAWPCSSYFAYLLGRCPPTNNLVEVGENVRTSTIGMYFVNTKGEPPYAMGKWTNNPKINSTTDSNTQTTESAIPLNLEEMVENVKSSTVGMYFINSKTESPHAMEQGTNGGHTNSQTTEAAMGTRVDPLFGEHNGHWEKLNYHFNYHNESTTNSHNSENEPTNNK